MSKSFAWQFALVLVVLIGVGFRFASLSSRPMHTDEAVHGIKFAQLLEDGYYRYDPYEYHGPTLNYLTLPVAWATGADSIEDVSEAMLRIVPALSGLGIILLILALKPILPPAYIAAGALLTAISPAMVFYSRYYIQEMLLVFFLFGLIVSAYRYLHSQKIIWIVLAGLAAGLAFATKETFVIAFGAGGLSIVAIIFTDRQTREFLPKLNPFHLIYGLIAAVAISILFYSSFFTNPSGVIDSVRTFTTYLSRAEGDGHANPWHYFLRILFYWDKTSGPVWTEWLIVLGALGGICISFAGRDVPRRQFWKFLGFYGFIQLAVYSAIPYKTPWCIAGFVQPMALLAGFAIVWLVSNSRGLLKAGLIVLAAVGFVHLGYLAYLNTFRYSTDPGNPYVHTHPREDFYKINEEVRNLLEQSEEYLTVQVIFTDHEYWPLPWYFRDLPQIGYHSQPSFDIAGSDIIIADIRQEQKLVELMYQKRPPGERDLYLPVLDIPAELRPAAAIQIYIKANIWTQMTSKYPNGENIE